jgi:hypothetical protein
VDGILRSIAGSLSTAALDGNALALALETLGGNQTLDLGGLGVVLLALLGDGTADDELADVVLLVETEEATDLGGTLGAETLGDNGVGQAGELALALLDDGESKDGKVLTGDGTTDRLALALTGTAGTVAAVAVGEEQTGTGGQENCRKSMSMMRYCGVPGDDNFLLFPQVLCGRVRTTLLHRETCNSIVSILVPVFIQSPKAIPGQRSGCVPCLSLPPVILKR